MYLRGAVILEVTLEKCRKCGAEIPVNPGYTPWCDKCGWNIVPNLLDKEENLLEKFFYSIGKKSSEMMLKKVIKEHDKKPKLTLPLAVAYAIAIIIYIISGLLFLLFIAIGVIIIRLNFNYVGIVVALVFFFFAYLGRPRFRSVKIKALEKGQFAGVYGILEKIIVDLRSTKIDGIAVSGDYNASFVRSGINGKKYIIIGLPLFYVLEDDERVALLSHEIAHNINNDVSRSVFISEVLAILERWYDFFIPEYMTSGIAVGGILAIPVNFIKLIFAKFIYLIWYILSILLWRNKQVSEYYADYLASKVSGTDAMVSLLEKSHFNTVFYEGMKKSSIINYSDNLFEKFKNKISMIPDRELKRIKAINESSLYSIDASHPPTAFRIRCIKENFHNANIEISKAEFEQMNVEIELLCNQLQREIINYYRA